MRKSVQSGDARIALALPSGAVVSGQVPAPPPWAYGFTLADRNRPPLPARRIPSRSIARASGRHGRRTSSTSCRTPTRRSPSTHIHYDYGPADWYPDDHPPMPEIVARGRESDKLRAVRPLPLSERTGQARERSGRRPARRVHPAAAGGVQERHAAERRPEEGQHQRNDSDRPAPDRRRDEGGRPSISRPSSGGHGSRSSRPRPCRRRSPGMNGLFLPQPGNETEPLGKRILEVPENPDVHRAGARPAIGHARLRARRQHQARRGDRHDGRREDGGSARSATAPICRASAPFHRIADRQTSYIARQLYDYQAGTRESPLMKPVVAKLTEDDMIAIAAYLGSK